jgi:hypothetical protein
MTKRAPPRLATWILAHVAPDYRRESFIGDLIEQYGQGRTARWYWSQVGAVIGVATARLLRAAISVSAAALMLRLAAESLAVTSILSLIYETQRTNTRANLLPTMILAGLALLCLVASALCAPPPTSVRRSTRPSSIRRLFAAFAVITLSAATLTWAGTTSGPVRQPTHAVICPESR